MSQSRGLTRGQVVVALVAIALFVGIGVTAIARMREAAAQVHCRNNLTQLATGLLNYQSTFDGNPPLLGRTEPDGKQNLRSVFAHLCPYLAADAFMYRPGEPAERYSAHSSVAFPFRWKDNTPSVQHGGDANQLWRTFHDPADSSTPPLRDVPVALPDGSTGYFATGSYAVNRALPWGKPTGAEPPFQRASVVVFAERPQVCRTEGGEVVHNLWGVSTDSPQLPVFSLPTDQAIPFQFTGKRQHCDPRLPGTPHRDGLHTTMSDGSIRVFAPGTDPEVFRFACQPR
jgi:hypothetical protein